MPATVLLIVLTRERCAMWTLYLIECVTPNHFYVGITSNYAHRLKTHRGRTGARFTYRHGVKSAQSVHIYPSERLAKLAERLYVAHLRYQGKKVAGAGFNGHYKQP